MKHYGEYAQEKPGKRFKRLPVRIGESVTLAHNTGLVCGH